MPNPPVARTVSTREHQVLQLVAEGEPNSKIAALLGMSPATVKSHLYRIGLKLGTGDRAGMVGAAFRKGILR